MGGKIVASGGASGRGTSVEITLPIDAPHERREVV
jgi:hypothetical protein